jgi:hypothetical protein
MRALVRSGLVPAKQRERAGVDLRQERGPLGADLVDLS